MQNTNDGGNENEGKNKRNRLEEANPLAEQVVHEHTKQPMHCKGFNASWMPLRNSSRCNTGGLFSIVILYPSAEIARVLAPCIPETKENWLVWLFDGWQK